MYVATNCFIVIVVWVQRVWLGAMDGNADLMTIFSNIVTNGVSVVEILSWEHLGPCTAGWEALLMLNQDVSGWCIQSFWGGRILGGKGKFVARAARWALL
jgi:hypothetical protein